MNPDIAFVPDVRLCRLRPDVSLYHSSMEKDMKKYWRDYYEMNQEHEQIVEELYLKKMTNDSFLLDAVQKEKLMEWFGEEITYCKQSLEEIGIMFD